MHDQYKVERVLVDHAIKYQHGLHSEMPRTSTIGGRHDDGNGSDNEGHHRTGQSQVFCKVEAEECQVIVQEITAPDAYRVEDEQRQVLDILQ